MGMTAVWGADLNLVPDCDLGETAISCAVNEFWPTLVPGVATERPPCQGDQSQANKQKGHPGGWPALAR
jgi:hypothetical protein